MSETTDRTPTTEDMRYSYIESAFEWDDQEAAEAFARWLAEHDAEVRTAALEKAAELLRREAHRVAQLKILKPDYRQALVDTFYEASRVVTRAAKGRCTVTEHNGCHRGTDVPQKGIE